MNANELFTGDFGTCCSELKDCTTQPNSMFRVEDNGTLYLSIAYVETEQGIGWFDQAVMFCPSCGKHLQDKEGVADRASADET